MKDDSKIYFVLHRLYDPIRFNHDLLFEDTSKNLFNFLLSSLIKLRQQNRFDHHLTFDDGNISDYTIAYPLLLNNSINASFFVITDLINSKNYLTWEMISEMSNSGMYIGSHSCSHKNLLLLNDNDLDYEIKNSKNILEQKLGKEITSFSCPYGLYDKRIQYSVKINGYKNFFTSDNGLSSPNSFKKNRNSINSITSQRKIYNMLIPSNFMQIKWVSENLIKKSIKNSISMNNYLKIRSFFTNNFLK